MSGSLKNHTVEQNWPAYTEDEHAIWRLLFERQQKLLKRRACREYLDGLQGLGVASHGIPDFRRLSDILDRATGWRIAPVAGLVPDDVFVACLAARRFPSTCFIRRRDQLDYLQEPDVFHDICGHVPMLMNPVFADYMREAHQEILSLMQEPAAAASTHQTPGWIHVQGNEFQGAAFLNRSSSSCCSRSGLSRLSSAFPSSPKT